MTRTMMIFVRSLLVAVCFLFTNGECRHEQPTTDRQRKFHSKSTHVSQQRWGTKRRQPLRGGAATVSKGVGGSVGSTVVDTATNIKNTLAVTRSRVTSMARTVESALSPAANNVAQFAGSTWIVTKYVVSNHLVEMIQHPQGRVIKPMKKLVREAKNEASGRTSRATSEGSSCSNTSQNSSSLEVRGGKVVQPPSPTEQANYKRRSAGRSNDAMFGPTRVTRHSVVAFVLGEVLDRFGLLSEETPALIRAGIHNFWHNTKIRLHVMQYSILNWWESRKVKKWDDVPVKYKFAIGASAAMTVAPAVVATIPFVLPTSFVLYSVAELNANLREKGSRYCLGNLLGRYRGGSVVGEKTELILDRLRFGVRGAFSPAHNDWQSSQRVILSTYGGARPAYSLGMKPYYRM